MIMVVTTVTLTPTSTTFGWGENAKHQLKRGKGALRGENGSSSGVRDCLEGNGLDTAFTRKSVYVSTFVPKNIECTARERKIHSIYGEECSGRAGTERFYSSKETATLNTSNNNNSRVSDEPPIYPLSKMSELHNVSLCPSKTFAGYIMMDIIATSVRNPRYLAVCFVSLQFSTTKKQSRKRLRHHQWLAQKIFCQLNN